MYIHHIFLFLLFAGNSYRDIMHCNKKPFYFKRGEDSVIMDAYLMHTVCAAALPRSLHFLSYPALLIESNLWLLITNRMCNLCTQYQRWKHIHACCILCRCMLYLMHKIRMHIAWCICNFFAIVFASTNYPVLLFESNLWLLILGAHIIFFLFS